MPATTDLLDPIEAVPEPEAVRLMLAETIRRRELLRSLLRVAIRKANYPPPTRRPRAPLITEAKEGGRG